MKQKIVSRLIRAKGRKNMNKLLNGLTVDTNKTAYTANGALSNVSSLDKVLDFYYHASASRGQDNSKLFASAWRENSKLAVKAAFYTRDVRGGQGERETFRQVLRWLYKNDRATFDRIVPLVPVYGRWDDILEFVDSPVVVNLVRSMLWNDRDSEHPSLLAKWMPSANVSSEKTQKLAMKWMLALGLSPRLYRKLLVSLRNKIVLVESLMSAKAFDKIDYEHVPSNASKLYRKAFSKRDADRYVAYLESVKKGEKKINAATLYPYEIVGKYLNGSDRDDTLEALWSALPDYVEGSKVNATVVADVSGSMSGRPMEVSISLAMYFAERSNGPFKNHFMTFSHRPTLQRLVGTTVYDRVKELSQADWEMNTNIQAVFDLVLATAVKNNVPQDEMLTHVFIVSDMQFDSPYVSGNATNFEVIKRKFAAHGYAMPILVFWNVNSFNKETPVTKNEKGVFLVSGASPSIFKAALNTRATTPYELMLDVLNSDRYAPIDEVLM